MDYWQTAEQAGLSKDQIRDIAEELYKERISEAKEACNDCGAEPGEPHLDGCDVARCEHCGGQALSCDCYDQGEDIWTGLWPGIKECYEQQLICRGNFGKDEWTFDLNTLAVRGR